MCFVRNTCVWRFRLANIPVASIYKGRVGKEKLVRRRHKVLENQKSSFRRYADVLEKLGFPVLLNFFFDLWRMKMETLQR